MNGRSSLLHAVSRHRSDRLALAFTVLFAIAAMGAWTGLWGGSWASVTGQSRAPISWQHWLGTNAIGQDVFDRMVVSAATAFETGLLVAVLASVLGLWLGALAGYYRGGWLDRIVLWLAGVLDAVPFLLFVAAAAWALDHHAWAMQGAMVVCFWTTTARLVRAEVIRLKPLGFVESARALGLSDFRILQRHILPNALHVVLVQASLLFVAAIKTEVILSFLGLGIRDGVSWGVMIAESTHDVLAGQFNNFLAGSLALFVMVMSFNHLADRIQDALDPRREGS